MFRSLATICAVGATFFLVALVAGEPPSGTGPVLWLIDGIGFAIVVVLVLGRRRLPSWTGDICGILLTLVVGLVILIYADADSACAFFYLWLTVHSFFFLPWRRAALQLALMIADYAVMLAVLGAAFPLVRWWITVMTAVVVSAMVALLKARVDSLVEALATTARTDTVTGLTNRRAFDELFDNEVARAERGGDALALVLGDLDGFKAVNDRFGHPQGDSVLRRVAKQLHDGGRRVDVASRLGGDEFALVLPGADVDGAHRVAERMRLAIASDFAREDFELTISFGIACFPNHGADAGSVFLAADAALLAAKEGGKNRCLAARASGAAAARLASAVDPSLQRNEQKRGLERLRMGS